MVSGIFPWFTAGRRQPQKVRETLKNNVPIIICRGGGDYIDKGVALR